MKIIDIHVLTVDGPAARFYLHYMHQAGYQPRKITCLRMTSDNFKVRVLEKFLGVRLVFAVLSKNRWKLFDNKELRKLYTLMRPEDGSWPDFYGAFNLNKYCNNVENIYVKGWKDPRLSAYIEAQESVCFLYTGGGLVPDHILKIPRKRFIHVHPGLLPEVRGADCFFWSLAVRGVPGATCFYMDSGIDTGRIIRTKEFSLANFNIDARKYSMDNIYNAFRYFYDHSLRAELLLETINLSDGEELHQLNAKSQHIVDGETYFFMHPELRNKIISAKLTKNYDV